MGSKTLAKKKAHRAFCREQVVKGLINQADGGWGSANTGKAMDRDMIAGYKIGRAKVERS